MTNGFRLQSTACSLRAGKSRTRFSVRADFQKYDWRRRRSFQRNSRLAVSDEVSRGNPSGRTPFRKMWQHCAARYRSLSPGTAVDGSCWLPVAVASPFANGLLRASIVYPPRLLDLQFFFFLVLVSDVFFLYLLLNNT